jgi:hypothetical protein
MSGDAACIEQKENMSALHRKGQRRITPFALRRCWAGACDVAAPGDEARDAEWGGFKKRDCTGA